MKILTTVKVITEPSSQALSIKGKQVTESSIRTIDPIDYVNVLTLLGQKKKQPSLDLTVLNIGSPADRGALANLSTMGMNELIQLTCSPNSISPLDGLAKAKLLRDFVLSNSYGLVILGAQSSDVGSSYVGPALAGLLDWPCINCVKAISHIGDNGVTVTCSDGKASLDVLVSYPCVITCDLPPQESLLLSSADLAKGQPKPITINMIAETNYELRPQLSIVESIT
ncbi:MAG: hypothetical protein ACKEQK_00500, partial [Candidatus Hodgkinia cicadicola]